MAFTFYSLFSPFIILHLLILCPSRATTNLGFSANLIPRDSPLSPFYNPSKSHFDLLHDAFKRSLNRIHHFKSALLSSSESKIQTRIIPGGGEFLMNISIGTPPVEFIGIADTGSDLTWTQCLPCEECFHQTIPLFNPKHSSTYSTIPCQTSTCNELERAAFCSGSGQNSTCGYGYSYGDGSHTNGILSYETLTIGGKSLRKIAFGCGHDSEGTFDENESGIIGLGGGKLSLISQIGVSVGKKFSYCLVPTTSNNASGIISFGTDANVPASSGAITTPLVPKSPDTYYYLTLEGISVGSNRINAISKKGTSRSNFDVGNEEGNIIIDSGTTLTFLPSEIFDDVVSKVGKAVRGEKVEDPTGMLSLCYKYSEDLEFPILTVHFNGGDVKLNPFNYFAKVNDDVVCFTMVSSKADIPIYGNLAQMDFLVGYDLEAKTVTFVPTDCTKRANMCAVLENFRIRSFMSAPEIHGIRIENIPGCNDGVCITAPYPEFSNSATTGVLNAPHATIVTFDSTKHTSLTPLYDSYSKATPCAIFLALPFFFLCKTCIASQLGRITPLPDLTKSTSHVSDVPFFFPSLQPIQHHPQ
ncbi:aspartic proteinase CDR1-like [Senna tora]|uniref:Aspartic proteinase CDR1-like n=1 Tax=Senna tora TaxID=362788 RepID=A0A834T4P6_9FABA|nr:aspartic proteinase CDR1-like [Senna tora]